MKFSSSISLIILVIGFLSSTNAVADSPPSAPTNVSATFYAGAGGELFWGRSSDDRAVVAYEVTMNGSVIGEFDALSYYDSTLQEHTNYTFTVTAIDSAGQRSATANVILVSTALSAIQPQDISIQVYSDTAAELFWTPAARVRPAIYKNEIMRNGVLVATLQGYSLRSYFDDDRIPGEVYTYEVIAVSSDGRGSASISDTQASESLPIEAPSNVTATVDLPTTLRNRLDTTFNIINGVAFEKVLATVGKLADTEIRSSIGLVLANANNDQRAHDRFTCPNGGTLIVSPTDSSSEQRYSRAITGRDCGIGSIVFSGSADMDPSVAADDSFSPSSSHLRDVELHDARDLSTITSETMYLFSDETDLRFSRWSSYDVTVVRPQNSYRYSSGRGSGRDTLNQLPDGTFGLTGSAGIVTGVFSGTANMRTLGPFEFLNGRENGRPNAGRLLVETDSESLLINASTGDPSTFTLTLTTDDATTSYNVNFSETYRFEVPITKGVDVGF